MVEGRLVRIICLMTIACLVQHATADPPENQNAKSNHLAGESSPYLLQHAHNPVDWHPWGPEAFAKAKAEGKLVFLSSGYHACHWCHVMERESFENAKIAAILNQHFVCIKVDREERPDVDHVYMTALLVMGQDGGWPLSMFLTAEGKPIAGGTYWPPEDREIGGETLPGFATILQAVINVNAKSPENIEQTATLRSQQTRRALQLNLGLQGKVDANRELIDAAVTQLTEMFDPLHSGFGRAPEFRGPKFPNPAYLQLLQAEAARNDSAQLQSLVDSTLESMAQGGIYDQVGGGFHRYSTERTWTVPHFEKMLYDNAQLLEVYAAAYRRNPRPLYRRVLEETAEFVARELTSADGLFYTALDADSAGIEGRSYVWNEGELAAAITRPEDLALAQHAWGVSGSTNFEDETWILTARQPVSDAEQTRLQELKPKLLAVRKQRPQPNLDSKVLTSWNGLMIAGLAAAGQALDDRKLVERAAQGADRLLTAVKSDAGGLFHVYAAAPGESARARLPGYLDDYTHIVHGLLTLHDATQDQRWLTTALELNNAMLERFHDADQGGFYFTSEEHDTLFIRMKDQHDGVQPSGNSQAVLNLLRLSAKTGEERYRMLARQTIQLFAPTIAQQPTGLCGLLRGLLIDLESRSK
ncbi:MAG: thioredoxin domain-containing protein [Planctomycetaceae bacterium]|nr:thioredoxin domain-containing protein [Planctomycetaceae bacterium]